MGHKGKSSLSSGYVYAPNVPVGWGGNAGEYDELIELVYFHIRESLPKEVLPARYKKDVSYAAGWLRPCVHLTMDKCRTLVIFPLSNNRITFFRSDFSADKRAYQDTFAAEDPSFFDELDGVILKWFRDEQERWLKTKSRIEKKREKKESKEPISRSWRQIRGQPRRNVAK